MIYNIKCKEVLTFRRCTMNKLLKKLGFRKMDEMEQHIAFKAQRNALIFLLIALFIWSLYESYKVYVYHTTLTLFPCFLLIAASSIQTFSQLVMTRNAVKDDEDSFITTPLLKIIIFICVFVSIVITIGALFVFNGVKL